MSDHLTLEKLYEELFEHRDALTFLYPKWGQTRFTLCAPDVLEGRWVVWDNENKSTFSYGVTPLDAITTARRKLNHDNCQAYKSND